MTGQFATNIASVAEFAGAGLNRTEIAWVLNIGPNYVDILARHARVQVRKSSESKIDHLRNLAARGLTRRQAAQETGIQYECICRLAKQYGIEFPRQPYTGAETKISPRAQEMAALYKGGQTLKEIGDRFSITRERVRQVLAKHFGMTATDGGQHFKAEEKRRRFEARRDQRSLAKWGCGWDQYVALRRMVKPTRAFALQRRNAITRGIAWELNLWQWWGIWQHSGHWDERGRGAGYQMCRNGDTGAYAVGNVYIASGITNIQDYWHDVKSGARTRKASSRQTSTTPEQTKAALKAASDRYRKSPKFKLRRKLLLSGFPKAERDAIVAARFSTPSHERAA
jgi:DNA-binding CsgD family transcriptional regulator